jgi:hypothetical protein
MILTYDRCCKSTYEKNGYASVKRCRNQIPSIIDYPLDKPHSRMESLN